jgi:hypothetical protein
MPDHCPHFTTGFCTVCQALDQALAELQRVRGQRDRLAEAARPIVGYLADNRGRDGIEAALADIAARP